jgi:hypothetical protein
MKRDSGILVTTVGMVLLAVMCCVGLPLIVAAVAAVGAGALVGGLGAAVVIALIAVAVVLARGRLRQRSGMPVRDDAGRQ